jgi:hypothetical protein
MNSYRWCGQTDLGDVDRGKQYDQAADKADHEARQQVRKLDKKCPLLAQKAWNWFGQDSTDQWSIRQLITVWGRLAEGIHPNDAPMEFAGEKMANATRQSLNRFFING